MRKEKALAVATLMVLAASAGCDGDAASTDEDAQASTTIVLEPPAPDQGFQMAIETMAPAGTEIWQCFVDILPAAPSGLWPISRVEAKQTPGVHHMDVMALGLLNLPLEPGKYDCDELYRTYPEMMEEGIFLFATQRDAEALALPPGVVAPVPGSLAIMMEVHYVNPTPEDKTIISKVNAYRAPGDAYDETIWGSAVRDVDIDIPAGAEDHTEWLRCTMNRDVEVLLLSTHTHELSVKTEIFRFDGTTTGELVYEDDDWHAPKLQQYSTPIAVKKGEGFELRCHYANHRDESAHWGFRAEDEMCQFALVHTPGDVSASCTIVEQGVGRPQ